MNRFAIAKPSTYKQAGEFLAQDRFSLPVLKAGGMDVVDHLKEGLMEPDVLIDIRKPSDAKAPVTANASEITIAASATLSELDTSDDLNNHAPVLAQAAGSAASPQVRNVATAAGNLLQRPRCWYYRNETFVCTKKDGDTCYAKKGENRYHAIFWRGPCVIVHPSNLAPAMYVCDAQVHVMGANRRSLPISDLYHMPNQGVLDEHNLAFGEIITHVTMTPQPDSGFYAIKEKQSFDWPLVFACVALNLSGSTIESARVCAGAVAPVPWPLPKVEELLKGVDVNDDAAVDKACARAADGARPLSQNAYKMDLLPVALRRAVLRAAGRDPEKA